MSGFLTPHMAPKHSEDPAQGPQQGALPTPRPSPALAPPRPGPAPHCAHTLAHAHCSAHPGCCPASDLCTCFPFSFFGGVHALQEAFLNPRRRSHVPPHPLPLNPPYVAQQPSYATVGRRICARAHGQSLRAQLHGRQGSPSGSFTYRRQALMC